MRPEMWGAVLLFLGANALRDLRRREIHLPLTALSAMAGVCLSVCAGRGCGEAAAALVPGLCLFALSFLTRGGIGCGDGIVVLVLGLFLPAWDVLLGCTAAFSAASVTAGVRFLRSRDGRRTMPFVPFLLLGFLAVLVGRYMF